MLNQHPKVGKSSNRLGLALASLTLLASCGPPEKSAVGFRLLDGDVEAGRQAFLELQCHACHPVEGAEMPEPVADPPVPVTLGGPVSRVVTDGELLTSIVNPSHKVTRSRLKELVATGGESRMADYTEIMTAKELIDIVAFLHTIYVATPAGP